MRPRALHRRLPFYAYIIEWGRMVARECAPRQGKTTDYLKKQCIGNLGKMENGIVSVNAYGYYEGITFPLKCKIYKPKERDRYQSKSEIGAKIVKELTEIGFKIKRLLADSLYGKSVINLFSQSIRRIENRLGSGYPQQSSSVATKRAEGKS